MTDFVEEQIAEFQKFVKQWDKNTCKGDIDDFFRSFASTLIERERERIKGEVEGMKVKVDDFAGWTIHHDEGYNEALSDVCTKLQEMNV